jgi:hypothetical protein
MTAPAREVAPILDGRHSETRIGRVGFIGMLCMGEGMGRSADCAVSLASLRARWAEASSAHISILRLGREFHQIFFSRGMFDYGSLGLGLGLAQLDGAKDKSFERQIHVQRIAVLRE